jgi:hypothetical protein
MYSSAEICPAQHDAELAALDPAELARYRYFGGHFALRPVGMLAEQLAIVTLVRDPVTHLRSLYEHGRRESRPGQRNLRDMSFAEWLRADATQPLNANIQARFLAGAIPEVSSDDDDDLFNRAVATLDRCLWASTTERLETTVSSLAAALQWPPPPSLPRANTAPAPTKPPSAEEQDLIQRRAPVDIRLHRHIRAADPEAGASGPSTFDQILDRAARPLRRPLAMDLDHRFWGSGWLPPEAWWDPEQRSSTWSGDRAARWISVRAPATIDLPVQLRAGDRIDLLIAQAVPTSLERMQIRVNGSPARKLEPYWRYPRTVVPVAVTRSGAGSTRVTFCTTVDPEHHHLLESPTREGRAVAIEGLRLIPRGAV